MHDALAKLRTAAREAGLEGVTVAACVGPGEVMKAEACGFDMLTGYNYHVAGFTSDEIVNPIGNLLGSDRHIWDTIAKMSSLPYLPNVTLNWDPRPWRDDPSTAQRYTGYSFQSVYHSIRSVRHWISRHPRETSPERIALLYAWNENGEGGWLTPSKTYKDSLLLGLKKALVEK